MFKYVVLLHILIPGEQETVKQIGPDYQTAAACNTSYLTLEFNQSKPDTHRYECVTMDENGVFRNGGTINIIRPPRLGDKPDIIIESR